MNHYLKLSERVGRILDIMIQEDILYRVSIDGDGRDDPHRTITVLYAANEYVSEENIHNIQFDDFDMNDECFFLEYLPLLSEFVSAVHIVRQKDPELDGDEEQEAVDKYLYEEHARRAEEAGLPF